LFFFREEPTWWLAVAFIRRVLKPFPLAMAASLLTVENLRRVAHQLGPFDSSSFAGFMTTIALPVVFPVAFFFVLYVMRAESGDNQHKSEI